MPVICGDAWIDCSVRITSGIGGGDLPVGARQIQHVDFAHGLLPADRDVVAEPAVQRPRVQRGAGARGVVRDCAPPRSARRRTPCCGTIGPPWRAPNWFRRDIVLRLAVALVEPVVRVQALVAEVLIRAAGEAVGARPRHEVDGRAAMAADFGAAGRGRHGDRLDGVLARPHRREEPVVILVERVVVADAVERDVQERFGQPVDRRSAHAARRC